jgi:hypothetical protein
MNLQRNEAALAAGAAQASTGLVAAATFGRDPMSGPAAPHLSSQVVVVVLADVAEGSRLWGWSRIVGGPRLLRRVPGLVWAKVLGSGYEGGFGLRPSVSHQGLFLVFDHAAAAAAFVRESAVLQAMRTRSRECCVLQLQAWSSRGSWAGVQLPIAARAPTQGPIAALTRASIYWPRALPFWRMAPAAQQALLAAPGCRLAAGLGEAPLLRQATFSVWDSVQAMDNYARSGAHLLAIRAAHSGGYFSESMFVRFVPLSMHGTWLGRQYG